MIRSMTGYGRAAVDLAESAQIVVEIASVNRKNLDISVSLPREWQRLEPKIAEILKKYASRGRLNVSVSTDAPGGGETAFFNSVEVTKALAELEELSRKLEIPFEPDANLLFEVASSIRSRTTLAEADSIETRLLETVEEAADEMVAMRTKEGEALLRDLAERGKILRRHADCIGQSATNVVPDYRDALLKRLRQSGLEFTLEDDRVLKEIAIFADRCDISEELTRLESHLDQFDEFLGSREPVGRKLEFLLQEIGREFNTIGSKASDSTVSRLIIECKNELERVREQVQNIE